jgi:hypothetical protein
MEGLELIGQQDDLKPIRAAQTDAGKEGADPVDPPPSDFEARANWEREITVRKRALQGGPIHIHIHSHFCMGLSCPNITHRHLQVKYTAETWRSVRRSARRQSAHCSTPSRGRCCPPSTPIRVPSSSAPRSKTGPCSASASRSTASCADPHPTTVEPNSTYPPCPTYPPLRIAAAVDFVWPSLHGCNPAPPPGTAAADPRCRHRNGGRAPPGDPSPAATTCSTSRSRSSPSPSSAPRPSCAARRRAFPPSRRTRSGVAP